MSPGLFARGLLARGGAEGAEALAAMFKQAGYSAMALGHHDLGLARERLNQFARAAHAQEIPFVASNLDCDPQAQAFCAFVQREVVVSLQGQKVAVLATLSPLVAAAVARPLMQGLQLRSPRHESDVRLYGEYGYNRNRPVGRPAVGAETSDLIQLSLLHSYRGLRDLSLNVPRVAVPDPYVRTLFESEFSTPPQRAFRHAELTATLGGQFTLFPKLRVRGGPGFRKQLAADGPQGRLLALVEAGAILDLYALQFSADLAETPTNGKEDRSQGHEADVRQRRAVSCLIKPTPRSHAVAHLGHARPFGTMGAAIELQIAFHAMPNHPAATMRSGYGLEQRISASLASLHVVPTHAAFHLASHMARRPSNNVGPPQGRPTSQAGGPAAFKIYLLASALSTLTWRS